MSSLEGTDEQDDFEVAPRRVSCRRVPAAAQRAIAPLILPIARRTYAAGGDDPNEFQQDDLDIRFGCIDRDGNYLAWVANFAFYYRGVFRIDHGTPREIYVGATDQWMTPDLTGDHIPELVFRDDIAWHVLSSSWPEPLTFRDGTARIGRNFVVVRDGNRAALLVNAELRSWDGAQFAPVSQGFVRMRHALDAENEAIRRIASLRELLSVSTPDWANEPSAVCDDATRVTWASAVLRRLRDLGVSRHAASSLAAAPIGLQSCGASTAWGRASGSL